MKYIIILISTILSNIVIAQNDQGTIIYDRTEHNNKIIKSLPYLSQEEKDRQLLTFGDMDGWTSKYNLTFSPEKTVYTYGKEKKEYSYSWKKDEFLLIDDLKKGEITQQFDFAGNLYKIQDKKPRTKWKIKNEIREVAGYLCMKAVTQDTIKDQEIAAWFTDQLPVSAGPEGFSGLPGMILMLDINDGTVVVEAKTVTFETPTHPIPKKIKGKQITLAKYQELLKGYIKKSIEGERNPYWQIRY